jgi:hypothetical protein
MSKENLTSVVRVVGPVISKKDTNCRQCIGIEKIISNTWVRKKYLLQYT